MGMESSPEPDAGPPSLADLQRSMRDGFHYLFFDKPEEDRQFEEILDRTRLAMRR